MTDAWNLEEYLGAVRNMHLIPPLQTCGMNSSGIFPRGTLAVAVQTGSDRDLSTQEQRTDDGANGHLPLSRHTLCLGLLGMDEPPISSI